MRARWTDTSGLSAMWRPTDAPSAAAPARPSAPASAVVLRRTSDPYQPAAPSGPDARSPERSAAAVRARAARASTPSPEEAAVRRFARRVARALEGGGVPRGERLDLDAVLRREAEAAAATILEAWSRLDPDELGGVGALERAPEKGLVEHTERLRALLGAAELTPPAPWGPVETAERAVLDAAGRSLERTLTRVESGLEAARRALAPDQDPVPAVAAFGALFVTTAAARLPWRTRAGLPTALVERMDAAESELGRVGRALQLRAMEVALQRSAADRETVRSAVHRAALARPADEPIGVGLRHTALLARLDHPAA
jgi:hypothetical protein